MKTFQFLNGFLMPNSFKNIANKAFFIKQPVDVMLVFWLNIANTAINLRRHSLSADANHQN